MVLPGPSDDRIAQAEISEAEISEAEISERAQAEGVLDQLGARAETVTEELAAAIKNRPYATLAIAAALAFAVGALWKLGHRRPQTRLEAFRAQLPNVRSRMPSWNGLLERSWR